MSSGLAEAGNGLADAVAVDVHADDAPVVLEPGHRLKVADPAPGVAVFEVHKPVVALHVAHPAALVWAVDVSVALVEDRLPLVRAIDAL